MIRVIRHKCNKKIYRVNTFRGCVDVTEDHSLIGLNEMEIKPTDCVIGETEIKHTYPTEYPEMVGYLPRYKKEGNERVILDDDEQFRCNTCLKTLSAAMYYYNKNGSRMYKCKLCITEQTCAREGKEFTGTLTARVLSYNVPPRRLSEKEAWVMGFFFADGSCGNYKDTCQKASWALNNQNPDYLHKAMDYLYEVEPADVVTFKILDTLGSSGVYKLVANGSIMYMVTKYRELFYDKDNFKKVPAIILNSPLTVRKSFLDGYLTGDGAKAEMAKGQASFACKGKIGAMGLYYIVRSVGYTMMRVNIREVKPNIYFITTPTSIPRFEKNKDKVMKIQEIGEVPEGRYVYDIETSEGRFSCGVGETTLSNTDSVMIKFPFPEQNGKAPWKEKLAHSIKMGQEMSKKIKAIMPPPQSLEYEKTFYPWILLSKKRYVGNLYEDDPNKKPKQKSMGIVLKRRDNASILKKVYGGIINILLNDLSPEALQKSLTFLHDELKALVEGNTPLEELIITKTLAAKYKDPLKIAHKVLADRMGERDPGNKPHVNDRIPFVYIENPEAKLQGERIEHPDYIREQNLKPDHNFYITDQLTKPISQLYALVLETLPDYTLPQDFWDNYKQDLKQKYGDDDKKIHKMISQKKARVAEEILFWPYIAEKAGKSRTGAPKGKSGAKAKAALATAKAAAEMKHALIFSVQTSKAPFTVKYNLNGTDEEPISYTPKGKAGSKTAIWVLLVEKLFQKIGPVIKEGGVKIECGDKYHTPRLRKVIESGVWAERSEVADPTDIGACQEVAELGPYSRIAALLSQVNHALM